MNEPDIFYALPVDATHESDSVRCVREEDFNKLAAAGDALAHELLFRDHSALLVSWWALRGGHDKCTVCNPPDSGGGSEHG